MSRYLFAWLWFLYDGRSESLVSVKRIAWQQFQFLPEQTRIAVQTTRWQGLLANTDALKPP